MMGLKLASELQLLGKETNSCKGPSFSWKHLKEMKADIHSVCTVKRFEGSVLAEMDRCSYFPDALEGLALTVKVQIQCLYHMSSSKSHLYAINSIGVSENDPLQNRGDSDGPIPAALLLK